jgi:prepilin-type processing-associated H-X9-DG protein
MACGFGEGYFGMQNNSPHKRRVLFSVWSPFVTDNPKEIPDSLRVKLVKKGKNVTINDFGNEGSGGQSYMWSNHATHRKSLNTQPSQPFKFTKVKRPGWKMLMVESNEAYGTGFDESVIQTKLFSHSGKTNILFADLHVQSKPEAWAKSISDWYPRTRHYLVEEK